MNNAMRGLMPLALAAVLAPSARAQSIFDAEYRLAPQILSYHFKAPFEQTVTEFALPVFVSMPFGPSFTFDVGTAYAMARVAKGDGVSQINGLTDTQLRGNYTFGNDFVVITGGVNLPTGRATVDPDQISAAGIIGSDFLAFPISNMGTGLAATAGIAVARPLGDWNLGFGGSLRKSQSYTPFNLDAQSIRFQPGNEYRARVGADHPFGTGRASVGVTFSAFGNDDAGGSVYNTGNRVITQAVVTNQLNQVDITVAAYDLFRGSGNYAGGLPAGKENILNGFVGLGFRILSTYVEPNLEVRHWLQNIPGSTSGSTVIDDRSQSSYLGTIGVRARFEYGGMTFFPGAGYTIGQLATVDDANAPSHAGLTGVRAQIAFRLAP